MPVGVRESDLQLIAKKARLYVIDATKVALTATPADEPGLFSKVRGLFRR